MKLISMNRSLLFGLSMVATVSAHASPIVGGEEVPANDPSNASVVALAMKIDATPTSPAGMALCTASIIREDILVTAAHCVTDGRGKVAEAKNLIVAFGNDLHSQNIETRKVTAAIASPKWRANASTGKDWGDIAVVRFIGGLPSGYKKAKMLPAKTALEANEEVLLMGYGITTVTPPGQGDADTSGVLRRVKVPVALPKYGKTEVMLDQTSGRGACHGDSGGPAYLENNGELYLWGVTSRGGSVSGQDNGDRCDGASVFTRITAYTAFINKAIKDLKAAPGSSSQSEPTVAAN